MYNKKINEIIEEYRNKLNNKNYSKTNNIGILITELETNGFMVENPHQIPHVDYNQTEVYNIKIQDKESPIKVNMYRAESGIYEITLYDTSPEESLKIEQLRDKKIEIIKDSFQEAIKDISRENVDNYFQNLENLNEDNIINIINLTQTPAQRKKEEVEVLKEYGESLAKASKGETVEKFDFFYTPTPEVEPYINKVRKKTKLKP